ncbi:2-oxoacid:acceptor oxidoreductase subunit alpha [archaeon]|nr:2-oxoacid:acceptor oxidoreductase subunit alpha [archaeon]NDB54513.1 2-oxoacid:acceptor oxidoreductase subunit alpha [archaeon]NDB78441.1 2-oxoacid:acceptor oxidoreductase subunit alpha [archaeon]NDF27981.1 2-oxoacid:acceptor oxidoreductase subunit alpha [archaeon]
MVNQKIDRFSMRWGGFAGDGLQSTGILLQKYFNSLGYYVQGFPGTQSTIRGGHVWQHVEISSSMMHSHDRKLNLIVALNEQTLEVHCRDLKDDGIILYNSTKIKEDKLEEYNNFRIIPLAMSEIARSVDLQTSVLANTVAVGAVLAILNLDLESYEKVLEKRFGNRENILAMNKAALLQGYDVVGKNGSLFNLENVKKSERFVASGNEMIALGAACSGLKFLAQYPITPASSILTYLSKRADKYGVVVRQAEDELAAINMVIGASYAGARAMTASSGPGISLMAESFGYASMTETPIVVVNSMRGGPSTGIPTKMEQADLNSMIHLSHGEAPRIILAPRNIREAFDITVRAFNLADIYQIPVIILSDFSLSERTENLEPFDLSVKVERGKIWKEPTDEYPTFARYKDTEDGIAPRAFPGTKDAQYILVGAEHDEESHSLSGNRCGLPESWEVRDKMIKRRYRKFELIKKELNGPDIYGDFNEFTLICWGSIEGAVREAADRLNESGEKFNVVSFADIYPLSVDKIIPVLEKVQKSIMIEVNYTGQFENLLKLECNWEIDYRIHPLSGETPTSSSLIPEILKVIGMEGDYL